MIRKIKILFTIAGLLQFCAVSIVYAQELGFEATVTDTIVEVGRPFNLTLNVTGTQDVPLIKLPDIENMTARFLGPNTRISIVNGQYSSSVAYLYSLTAQKKGHMQIPAMSIEIKGQTYTTDPIDIQVMDGESYSNYSQNQNSLSSFLQDKVFIVISSPLKEAYLSERVPVSVKLFVQGINVAGLSFPDFSHEGFVAKDFGDPSRYQQVIGGVRYEVVDFKTVIYPSRTGELTIGPAVLQAKVEMPRQRQPRSPFAEFDSFFDEGFLSSFFGEYRQIPLESADLKLNVRDIPQDGRTDDFTGAVGQFHFNAEISPKSVKVGDPVTVRVTVSGDGNLQPVKLPSYSEAEDIRVYEPEISLKEDMKTLEQVVIPRNEKLTELPALRFSYFDVVNQEFKTLTAGPFPLKVKPADQEAGRSVVGLPDIVSEGPVNNVVGEDLLFIKKLPGKLRPAGRPLAHHSAYWVTVIVLFLAWVGAFIAVVFGRRLKTDQAFARKFKAPRKAQKGLAEAEKVISRDTRQFYDSLFKTMQNYMSHKLHIPVGAIARKSVEKKSSGKIPSSVLEKLDELLADCEMIRYASGRVDEGKMKQDLQSARDIIDQFERSSI